MDHDVLDAHIESYEEFGSIPVRPGEQVFLYRRLADAYDPGLIAVVNEMSEPLGFLERELAVSVVLPALKEGVRFQCVVHGETDGGTVPIRVTSIAQSEVTAILERRGGLRRGQSSSAPPLAGVFDDDASIDDDDADGELSDEDVEAESDDVDASDEADKSDDSTSTSDTDDAVEQDDVDESKDDDD